MHLNSRHSVKITPHKLILAKSMGNLSIDSKAMISNQLPRLEVGAEKNEINEKQASAMNNAEQNKINLTNQPGTDSNDQQSKFKNILNRLMEHQLNKVKKVIDQVQYSKMTEQFSIISETTDIEQYITLLFQFYNQLQGHSKPQKEEGKQFKLRLKQKKKLILIDQNPQRYEKIRKTKKINDLIQQNQAVKRENFGLKQAIKGLQKRLLNIIQQFKERKSRYLSQIEKLTKILNFSIKNIPELIYVQRENRLFSKQLPQNEPLPSIRLKKDVSAYNTLFNATNDTISQPFGYQSPKKVNLLESPRLRSYEKIPTSSQRFKSEQILYSP